MSMQLKWNSSVVVKRMQQEFPAVIEYALYKLNSDSDNGVTPHTLPKSSVMVLRYITHDIISSTKNTSDVFDCMGVKQGNWLLLNKRVYQWVEKTENLNEILAFKML